MHDPHASKPAPGPPCFALLHNRRGERHLNQTGDLERAALAYGRAARLDPEDEAAWWNTGIAATAPGDWAAARRAWEAAHRRTQRHV